MNSPHNLGLGPILQLPPNEPLGTKGPPLVGEEVHKKDVGKVGSSYISIIHDNILLHKC